MENTVIDNERPSTSSSQTGMTTRTSANSILFDAKTTCIICQQWHKSQKPSGKIATPAAQASCWTKPKN